MACGCAKHTREAADTATEAAREANVAATGNFRLMLAPDGERIKPLDQCIACTQKHLSDAYAARNEFAYETINHAHVMGQLQAAIHHSCKTWRGIADALRELFHAVQAERDTQVAWEGVIQLVAEQYAVEQKAKNTN